MVDALFRHLRKVFTNKLFLQFYCPKDSVPTSHIDLANLDLRALASSVLNDKFLVFRTPNTKKQPSSDVPNLKVFSMWLQCHSKYERVRTTNAKKIYSYFIYTFSLTSQHTSFSPHLVLSSPISPPFSQPRWSHHIDHHATPSCRPPSHAVDLASCERFHSFIFQWWFFLMLPRVLLLWWLFLLLLLPVGFSFVVMGWFSWPGLMIDCQKNSKHKSPFFLINKSYWWQVLVERFKFI